jgi:predicted AAA+ superfamily ATPase
MGNNHEKYFSEKQRKVIIIGPQASGKTTMFKLLSGEANHEAQSLYVPTEKFQNA